MAVFTFFRRQIGMKYWKSWGKKADYNSFQRFQDRGIMEHGRYAVLSTRTRLTGVPNWICKLADWIPTCLLQGASVTVKSRTARGTAQSRRRRGFRLGVAGGFAKNGRINADTTEVEDYWGQESPVVLRKQLRRLKRGYFRNIARATTLRQFHRGLPEGIQIIIKTPSFIDFNYRKVCTHSNSPAALCAVWKKARENSNYV